MLRCLIHFSKDVTIVDILNRSTIYYLQVEENIPMQNILLEIIIKRNYNHLFLILNLNLVSLRLFCIVFVPSYSNKINWNNMFLWRIKNFLIKHCSDNMLQSIFCVDIIEIFFLFTDIVKFDYFSEMCVLLYRLVVCWLVDFFAKWLVCSTPNLSVKEVFLNIWNNILKSLIS